MRYLAMTTILMAAPLLAQEAAVSAAIQTTPLAVAITAPALPKAIFPDFVTVSVTNTGTEILRLPMPGMGGPNAASGSIKLTVNGEEPKRSFSPPTDASKWQTLKPGDSLNFAERISEVTDTSQPGEYILCAIYTPPTEISHAREEKLYQNGQAYPHEAAESAPMTLHREEGQASVVLHPLEAFAPAGEQ